MGRAGPLWSELETYKSRKARFWPWLEPFFSQKSSNPIELFPARSPAKVLRRHVWGVPLPVVSPAEFRVWCSGLWAPGLGFRVSGFGFRVSDFESQVSCSELRVRSKEGHTLRRSPADSEHAPSGVRPCGVTRASAR